MPRSISDGLQLILDRYGETPPGTPWPTTHPVRTIFSEVVESLQATAPLARRPTIRMRIAGLGRQASVPWIGFLDSRETTRPRSGVYCVYLFREDLSGIYLTLAIGVEDARAEFGRNDAGFLEWALSQTRKLRPYAAGLERSGFSLDNDIDLRSKGQKGQDYETATVAHHFYANGAIPSDAALIADLEAVLLAYDRYLDNKLNVTVTERPKTRDEPPFDIAVAVTALIERVAAAGFTFEPWQIAAYVAALRTKPFVILAGVTGTGKSTIPGLVAKATGGRSDLVPVRPDWTDSSEVIGYRDLQSTFRPGVVLQFARQAMRSPDMHHVVILDEMNLARVEQYLAEVLSNIEQRASSPTGGFASGPLLVEHDATEGWSDVLLPANLALVGTVNMDESAHGFSRKVLDRAFTLELSEIDLTTWNEGTSEDTLLHSKPWPVSAWYPRAHRLSALSALSEDERADIGRAIDALVDANRYLVQAQLQVGYRTRDEVALFVLHSRDFASSFITRSGIAVDPLDLALHMKVLPRIIGGSAAVRRTVLQLLGWSYAGIVWDDEEAATTVMALWSSEGRPSLLPGARYPRTAARLCLMWDRVLSEGFTSYWL